MYVLFAMIIVVVLSSSQIEGQRKGEIRRTTIRRIRFLILLFFFFVEKKTKKREREGKSAHLSVLLYMCVQATNMSVNERQQQRKFIVLTTNVDACQTC